MGWPDPPMTDDHRPLWLRPAEVGHDELPDACDDLVVGAGVVGLTTAVLLARAGRRVCVVEARDVGAGSTGHSSAKVSLLQGTRLSTLLERHPRDVVQSYVDLNRAGFDWLVDFAAARDVRIERRTAATFAASPTETSRTRAEFVAARSVGLPVEWRDDLDLPVHVHGATTLADQAQVDPGSLLTALAAELRAHRGALVENARVARVDRTGPPTAHLQDGRRVRAESLVVATGSPVLDRSLAFSDLEPQRSYVVGYELADPPEIMALSSGSPSVSLRDARTADGRPALLVGGFGHGVGRTRSESEHVEAIRTWTAEHFPDAREVAAWSAQDYTTGDGLPRFGRMPRGGGRIRFATGFAKWGFTTGTAAALAMAHDVLGAPMPWAGSVVDRSSPLESVKGRASINAKVAKEVATGAVRALSGTDAPLGAGEGRVRRDGVHVVAESRSEAGTCRVSGLCTHLGGVLRWNDHERSWDCPLHGSRFSADGEVLNGPATRPLRPLDEPAAG